MGSNRIAQPEKRNRGHGIIRTLTHTGLALVAFLGVTDAVVKGVRSTENSSTTQASDVATEQPYIGWPFLPSSPAIDYVLHKAVGTRGEIEVDQYSDRTTISALGAHNNKVTTLNMRCLDGKLIYYRAQIDFPLYVEGGILAHNVCGDGSNISDVNVPEKFKELKQHPHLPGHLPAEVLLG